MTKHMKTDPDFEVMEDHAKKAPSTLVAADQLRSLIERIERLETEKAEIADEIKEVFGEAKANGFDVKAMRSVIRLRKMDADERAEADLMLELYREALGV